MTSLNPVFTVGKQIGEVLLLHQGMTGKQAKQRSIEMLEAVKIPNADQMIKRYPHQLSGGMLQRVMIAMAMILDPRLLIADEPTTALDVTIQAQILALMNDLKEHYDTAVLIITHDLGVIAETCRRVAVLYAGQVVEQGNVSEIFHNPAHPYTRGLLKSMNTLGAKEKLFSIKGTVPSMDGIGRGCRFSARCDFVDDGCKEEQVLKEVSAGHICRCHKRGVL